MLCFIWLSKYYTSNEHYIYSKSKMSSIFTSSISDRLSPLPNSISSSSSSDIGQLSVTTQDATSYLLPHVGIIPCFFITGNQYPAQRAAIRKQRLDCLWAYATIPLLMEDSRFFLRLAWSNHHVDLHSKNASTRRISSWIIKSSSFHRHIRARVWAHSERILWLNSSSVWLSPLSFCVRVTSHIHDGSNRPLDVPSSGLSGFLPGPRMSEGLSYLNCFFHWPFGSRAISAAYATW